MSLNYRTTFYCIIISLRVIGMEDVLNGAEPQSSPVVERAKKLSQAELEQYIKELASKKDFTALESIAELEDLPGTIHAASIYSVRADPANAIALCTRLRLLSP